MTDLFNVSHAQRSRKHQIANYISVQFEHKLDLKLEIWDRTQREAARRRIFDWETI